MKLITEWDNDEKTIMRVTYQSGWSWDDMQANGAVEKAFLDSVNHKVDVIADFRGTQLPPNAMIRLPQIAVSPPYTHRNSGLMVMVGSPAFMEEVVAVYRRLYGRKARKLHVLPDLETARKTIAELNQEPSEGPAPTATVNQGKPE